MISGDKFTDTEKKIISLLSREESLSKKQIAKLTGISWGSVVKFITLLENKGILKVDGTLNRTKNKGKNAYTYSFNSDFPLAIGVDVEYRTTHITLTNLRSEILYEEWFETVPLDDFALLETFLKDSLRSFLKNIEHKESIIGIGIGLPGIGDPVFVVPDDYSKKEMLSRKLENQFGFPIRMAMNIKAYTMFENLYGLGLEEENFFVISIRTGVGGGIVLNGQLYPGLFNIAGTIGHFTSVPDGLKCYCGKRGCLETLISKEGLKRQYAEAAGKSIKEVSLQKLFKNADSGEAEAIEVVKNAAEHLGEAIGHALLILNISRVLVSTYYEGHYSLFHNELEKTINKHILPTQKVELTTRDLDPKAFSLGAALLVFQELFG